LVFDQLEDTFNSVAKFAKEMAVEMAVEPLGGMINILRQVPGICLIYVLQKSQLHFFLKRIPPATRQRMAEGDGIIEIPQASGEELEELIRITMRRDVWSILKMDPPHGKGLYPFSQQSIDESRIEAQGSIREFKQLMCKEFQQWMSGFAIIKQRMLLTHVVPNNVPADNLPATVQVHGQFLPNSVSVHMGGSTHVEICLPQGQIIAVTLPPHLVQGQLSIHVEENGDPENAADILLIIAPPQDHEVPKPYCETMCHLKLKARRYALKQLDPSFTQKWVGEQINRTQSDIARFETGKWINASDDFYEDLAILYGKPLRDFLKDDLQ